jgi:preprotein translocase SecE subunit
MAYKQDQGRMARMTAFWAGAIYMFYGCVSLHRTLTGKFDQLAQPMGGVEIPILGLDLSPALVSVTVLCLGGVFLFYRWLERPKQADRLIDTESEMRKVTWPSVSDAMSGSITVILTVMILMFLLAVFDWGLGRITTRWIF